MTTPLVLGDLFVVFALVGLSSEEAKDELSAQPREPHSQSGKRIPRLPTRSASLSEAKVIQERRQQGTAAYTHIIC